MHKVYLSLGTNLGNRKRNIREAIEKIEELVGVVERQSALYETKPWGFSSPNEPDLVIPHPLMEEREFVMIPLKEIL